MTMDWRRMPEVAGADRVSQLSQWEANAKVLRARLVEMSHAAQTPHLGSALSCVDILVAAYWGVLKVDPARPQDPLRDRFILSKGHAAASLYAALAFRGFFPVAELEQFAAHGGRLPEHPCPGSIPGLEAATGSLGHGLSLGLGMALAGRIQGRDYRVMVAMSDGECNEGSVWEAALFGAAQELGKVTAVIDYNKWQATGRSDQVLALAPLKAKWESFGWDAVEVDGHDCGELVDAMGRASGFRGKPKVVIAHTVKGKGVSFMEDDNNWHYKIPAKEQVEKAWKELGVR